MNWLRITWLFLVQSFYVAVTIYVFSMLRGRLEILAVSLTGILYVTMRSMGIGAVIWLRSVLMSLQTEFDSLKSHINQDFMVDSDERLEALERVKSENVPLWFDYGGLAVIGLLCLGAIFVTL